MEQLLTKADVARMLRVSQRSIQRYRAEGRIEAVRVGGLVRFRPEAVERFIEGK